MADRNAPDVAFESANATGAELGPLSPAVTSILCDARRDEQSTEERATQFLEPATTVLVVQADGQLPPRRSRRDLGQDTRTPGSVPAEGEMTP